MENRLLKQIGALLVGLAVMTLVCTKLDDMTTPRVSCIVPQSGYLDGTLSDCLVPQECVVWENGKSYVYLVEETSSCFTPVIARRVPVTVTKQAQYQAALVGFYARDAQVVRFCEAAMSGAYFPVRLWEEMP